MASTQQLKSRIRSVKSTKQITKAMQMVAASKMRRAQEGARRSIDYARFANEILTHFASQGVTDDHPLFAKRPIKNRLIIVIASDKGLAGAYNSNIFRTYIAAHNKDRERGVTTKTITVGRKVSQLAARLKEVEVIGAYDNLPDRPSGSEVNTIREMARDMFIDGEVDAVDVIYTEFVSSMTQKPKIKRLLPAGYQEVKVSDTVRDAVYEPNVDLILEETTRRLIGAQLFQAMLDARASEHSMRMIAMKNATDNASDLIDDLTLAMNKARQAAITQELSEISAGAEAIQ